MKDKNNLESSDYTTSVSSTLNQGLESLNKIKGTCQHLKLLSCGEQKAFNDIEKELKALKIIKEKGVDVGLLQHCLILADYNNAIQYELAYKELAQADFDLLKELL